MAFASDKKSGSRDYGYGNSGRSSQSFFGKTMRIEGEITSDEDLTIEGKVKGQLEVSKTITIGKEGYVNGKISAAVVRISGEAEGHLTASEKLEISSEGKYTGNIISDTIKVAEGAQIKGKINIVEEGETIAETKPQAKKAEKEAKTGETIEQPQEKKELKKQDLTKPAATK